MDRLLLLAFYAYVPSITFCGQKTQLRGERYQELTDERGWRNSSEGREKPPAQFPFASDFPGVAFVHLTNFIINFKIS